MKSYVNDKINDFEEWKKCFIVNREINKNVYEDPDSNSENLYKDLVIFLNAQEEKIIIPEKRFSYEFSEKPLGINVIKNCEILFILKSDQLGFSAFNHIYDRYIEKAEDENSARKQVCEWIYESRSIGGCFLWPMEKGDKGWITNPFYNILRGRGRMQDRVDMTLQDIKNCYEKADNSWLRNQCNKKENMKIWLDRFGTFNTYSKFFCFEPFIEGTYIKNLNGGTIQNFFGKEHKRKFNEYSFEELHDVLNNLNKWIKARTVKIETIIKNQEPK